ncbi:MAG TPA: ribosome small subunit-dependent GTPase A, partial [Bryobacteraceae bacterium]|nr:ribosome small subunit-dependent GTPase A [Bryobacteraceae bacterium]
VCPIVTERFTALRVFPRGATLDVSPIVHLFEREIEMTRQEKRALADMRHWDRDKRLRKLLAAKSVTPQQTDETGGTALVIGVGPGICTVSDGATTRQVRCDLQVAPGDAVSVRHEKVVAIAARRTTLARTDPANPHRERVIAANIDLLVIVASIDDPPFRPGLVDRYLIAAARGGIQPLLCMNKADLAEPARIAEALRPFAVSSVRCSAHNGLGIDDLRAQLAGNLAVFAGHSGVGKSSLLNTLLGRDMARTASVREDTGKGRHTTTSSSLIDLGNGARIIDTPGIREFGLGHLTLAELRAAFPEFDHTRCRFSGCTHRMEPGCAVRDAALPRYPAWLRLAGEL